MSGLWPSNHKSPSSLERPVRAALLPGEASLETLFHKQLSLLVSIYLPTDSVLYQGGDFFSLF